VQHFDDKSLEVDGKECRLQLIHFIHAKVKIDYDGLPADSFLIGLDKVKYDFFYSSSASLSNVESRKRDEKEIEK
jgi:hypothetical protein